MGGEEAHLAVGSKNHGAALDAKGPDKRGL